MTESELQAEANAADREYDATLRTYELSIHGPRERRKKTFNMWTSASAKRDRAVNALAQFRIQQKEQRT